MEAPGPETPEVLEKYKTAGKIATSVLEALIPLCVAGANVRTLCQKGDSLLLEGLALVYKEKVDDKAVPKGIAFPTCISVNNCVCHNSPLKSDKDQLIKDGDLIKIDLGAHVDGYIAVCAHTVVVGMGSGTMVKGRKADAILAAHQAVQTAAKMIRPGAKSEDVTRAIGVIAKAYNCTPIADMLSFQMKRFQIVTEKAVIQNPSENVLKNHKECVFEENEVYAVDVIMSTGTGKARQRDARTTVFKQTDERYQLRGKNSRALFSEVRRKFNRMPFCLRSCENEVRARMGMKECLEHDLIEPYHILFERDNEVVAQFRMTVALLPDGNVTLSGLELNPNHFSSEYSLSDEGLAKELEELKVGKGKKDKGESK